MTVITKPVLAAALSACAVAVMLPLQARAQAADDVWKWEVAVYGYLPALSGSTSLLPDGGGPAIGVSMGKLLDALKMGFMGAAAAKKRQWGLWTDLIYADVGGSKQASRDIMIDGNPLPVAVNANLVLDLKQVVWTLGGSYELANTPTYVADAVFGARLLDLNTTLSWSLSADVPGLPGRSGSSNSDLSYWDAIVGIKGRALIGDQRKWFVPYYLDVGTGQSKLTWQINAGIGYQFDWGALVASWRYLDYDFKSSSPLQSLTMNGPLVGAVFTF